MKQPEQEPKNQNKCPKCNDTLGVNAKLEPVCACSIDEAGGYANETNRVVDRQ